MFAGTAAKAVDYFAGVNASFACPRTYNPAVLATACDFPAPTSTPTEATAVARSARVGSCSSRHPLRILPPPPPPLRTILPALRTGS